jgi:hypothetical protein
MRKLIVFLCLLAAVAMAQPQAMTLCGEYGPPTGFKYGISIAETSEYFIELTSSAEHYGCVLPFTSVVEGYLGIYEPEAPTVLSDYVWFVNDPTFGPVMHLYSDVEGVPLVAPHIDGSVMEIGAEGYNYAIYEVPGDVQYTIYSDSVPEPSTLLLAGAALLVAGLLKWKLA